MIEHTRSPNSYVIDRTHNIEREQDIGDYKRQKCLVTSRPQPRTPTLYCVLFILTLYIVRYNDLTLPYEVRGPALARRAHAGHHQCQRHNDRQRHNR